MRTKLLRETSFKNYKLPLSQRRLRGTNDNLCHAWFARPAWSFSSSAPVFKDHLSSNYSPRMPQERFRGMDDEGTFSLNLFSSILLEFSTCLTSPKNWSLIATPEENSTQTIFPPLGRMWATLILNSVFVFVVGILYCVHFLKEHFPKSFYLFLSFSLCLLLS